MLLLRRPAMVPSVFSLRTSALFDLSTMSCSSLVPIESVPATVPVLPARSQAPAALPPHAPATLQNVGAPVIASNPITASQVGATPYDPRKVASFDPMLAQVPLR